jgi:hypothetical protein
MTYKKIKNIQIVHHGIYKILQGFGKYVPDDTFEVVDCSSEPLHVFCYGYGSTRGSAWIRKDNLKYVKTEKGTE